MLNLSKKLNNLYSLLGYKEKLFKNPRFLVSMSSKDKKPSDKELRAWLEEDFFILINNLKEKLGIKNTTEFLRVILKEKKAELEGENLNINIKINLNALKPIIQDIINAFKKSK